MSEMQVEPAPEAAPARRPRRRPASPTPVVAEEPQPAAPASAEQAATTEPGPEPTVAAQGASVTDVAAEPAVVAEPPPAPARRGTRRPAAIDALDLALPGVSSADIRAELARRERRVAKLLAERERVIAAMDEIEAALDAIGQGVAAQPT